MEGTNSLPFLTLLSSLWEAGAFKIITCFLGLNDPGTARLQKQQEGSMGKDAPVPATVNQMPNSKMAAALQMPTLEAVAERRQSYGRYC